MFTTVFYPTTITITTLRYHLHHYRSYASSSGHRLTDSPPLLVAESPHVFHSNVFPLLSPSPSLLPRRFTRQSPSTLTFPLPLPPRFPRHSPPPQQPFAANDNDLRCRAFIKKSLSSDSICVQRLGFFPFLTSFTSSSHASLRRSVSDRAKSRPHVTDNGLCFCLHSMLCRSVYRCALITHSRFRFFLCVSASL